MIVVSTVNSECMPLLTRIKDLIERSSIIYKIVSGLCFSRPLHPIRQKLRHVFPVVRTRSSNIALRRTDTKEEFQHFFKTTGLKIEKTLEYGGHIPEHFVCFASR